MPTFGATSLILSTNDHGPCRIFKIVWILKSNDAFLFNKVKSCTSALTLRVIVYFTPPLSRPFSLPLSVMYVKEPWQNFSCAVVIVQVSSFIKSTSKF